MYQNVASGGSGKGMGEVENDYKLAQLEGSKTNRNTSLNKFLKRKPDHKKIMMGHASKKKRESNTSDYFHLNTQSDDGSEAQTVSDARIQNSRLHGFGGRDHNRSRSKVDEENSMLESAKSQNNLFSRRKERQGSAKRAHHDANKISKGSFLSKQSDEMGNTLDQSEVLVSKVQDYNQILPRQRISSKKSKTEFFNFEQLKGLSEQSSHIFSKGDANELNSTRQYGDLSQEYEKLKSECESLTRRNKLLEQQLQLCTERSYLLQTEKKHIDEMLKEKDKIIDRLQRERSLFKIKGKSEIEKELEKYKEEAANAKMKLGKEEQRNANLKEENEQMRSELNFKNEELMIVYDQYTDLQAKYNREHQEMSTRLDKMKSEIERIKQQQLKEPTLDYGAFSQAEKWREKIFKQQEEIKYLQIQNQCLMISKEQLCKCEGQNRKLRDERDYFKKKIMQSIKKNSRKYMKDFSRSENSLVALQLSEMSS